MMNDNKCEALSASRAIGKKWTMLILQELSIHHQIGFNSLQDSLKKISAKVLSNQLQELEKNQLIHKEVILKKPLPESKYSLTEKGKALHQILNAFKEWNMEWGNGSPGCMDKECATCNNFLAYVSAK